MLANWYQIIYILLVLNFLYIVSVKFLEGLLIKGSKIIVITVIELCNTFILQIKGRSQEKRRVNTDPFLHRIYTIGLYTV